MKKPLLLTLVVLGLIALFVSVFVTNEPVVLEDTLIEINVPAFGEGQPFDNLDLNSLVVVEGEQVIVAEYFVGMQFDPDKECYFVNLRTHPIDHAFTTGVETDCLGNFAAGFIPLDEVIQAAQEAGLKLINPDALISP